MIENIRYILVVTLCWFGASTGWAAFLAEKISVLVGVFAILASVGSIIVSYMVYKKLKIDVRVGDELLKQAKSLTVIRHQQEKDTVEDSKDKRKNG